VQEEPLDSAKKSLYSQNYNIGESKIFNVSLKTPTTRGGEGALRSSQTKRADLMSGRKELLEGGVKN